MAILEIVTEPAEVLRKKARPVTKVNASIRKLLDDMTETMYEAPGVGLAAPQVGVSKRVIVLDPQDEEHGLFQLVNPEIIHKEGWVKGTEGCLSVPGYVGDVYRYEKVRVVALDRNGKKVWIDAEGWLARIFQHEIDHLDGILYTDKCSDFREVPVGEEEEAEREAAEAAQAAAEAAPAGPADAGSPEAVVPEAGVPEAGTPKAGTPEAGAAGSAKAAEVATGAETAVTAGAAVTAKAAEATEATEAEEGHRQ